jgi:peptidoglycan/xylan/chitin deacetylase (PgdA/CDA1 family)
LSITRRAAFAGVSLLLAAPAAADAHARARGRRHPTPFAWPGGAPGAVSLTYDDGLDSQLDHAAPQLDERGLRGTFFLTQENMVARLADWQALARRGHEIADHTMTHPCGLESFSAPGFLRHEIQPMEKFLDDNFGKSGAGQGVRTYAYPCGYTRLGRGGSPVRRARYRQVMQSAFLAARTVDGDPNRPADVLRHRFTLNAFEPTYAEDRADLGMAYVNKAVDHGAWAILVFHGVLPARLGDGDASTLVHGQILDQVKASGAWCAPMAEAFSHVAGGAVGLAA